MVLYSHIRLLYIIKMKNKSRDSLSKGLDSGGKSAASILDFLFLSIDILIQNLQLVYQRLLRVDESCWILLELFSFAALQRKKDKS